ncbi:hypothetical protein IFM89_037427 [Coptis chinensis]|uniref:Uncharacterized protein n=1 Tax=Coptis chinensis TaxID=261450 RepID=A0A835MGU1_9MAGN|nr:hypothetical protein IFM89_037427 [Coptis chinensis]
MDKWCGEIPLEVKFQNLFRYASIKNGSVEQHWTQEGNVMEWNFHLRRRNFRESEVNLINELKALLAHTVLDDEDESWRWNWTSNGTFSVKSHYDLHGKRRGDAQLPNFPYKIIWKVKLPLRIKFFM